MVINVRIYEETNSVKIFFFILILILSPPADRSQVEGRGLSLYKGTLPASAAAVRRPAGDAGVRPGPALTPRPPPPQQGLLRQRRLG